jgi:hypothetical protein
VERYLAEQAPDALLVTPLVDFGSRDADYLRAARRLGIPTGFPVFSWDNLTNKGLLRDAPDLVLVWNEFQAAEATELHRVPRERIRVTGAPAFDRWFGWEPSRSREEFCREVGLRADRPIVLYVCSSRFVAPSEFAFIREWIEQLRAQGGVLAEAGVLVRPHPLNNEWRRGGIDLNGEQVRVWPPLGEAPHDEASYRNYFDSIFHAGAVVGINTTAQIESAIVGRPVHTLLAEEFRETQEGTLHFHYLQAEGLGHLYVGRSFEEHAAQVEESLRGRVEEQDRNERFLRRFVRPKGLEVSATRLVVEAIEELGARPRTRTRAPLAAPLVRLALAPLARLAGRAAARRRAARAEAEAERLPAPIRRLRRTVKKALAENGPAVAGPWLRDEVGELLYWIPLLRWAQASTLGVRERLFVACRPGSAAWYAGIGSGVVESEDAPKQAAQAFGLGEQRVRVLDPEALEEARDALAREDPSRRIGARLLEFAPLAPPPLPEALEAAGEFLVLGLGFSEVLPDSAAHRELALALAAGLSEHGPLVVLDGPGSLRPRLTKLGAALPDGLDGGGRAAVVARSRGFVGFYGADAYLAVLTGAPAVAIYASLDPRAEADLRLAEAFLRRESFGALHAVSTEALAERPAERVAALLREPAVALAHV